METLFPQCLQQFISHITSNYDKTDLKILNKYLRSIISIRNLISIIPINNILQYLTILLNNKFQNVK